MLKSFRYLLFPFSIIYGLVITLRNFFFDKKIFKSANFNFPLICVGNLAVGGTGKTPMTEYLIELLQPLYNTATLSRGYKRKTKGFAIANATTTALEIGDEPMQFHKKYPAVTVAVGEERFEAIPQILHARPSTQVIILDDAFQHRSITAGLNILLTEYKNLYSRDMFLPVGDLRDARGSSKRAAIIVVTKCTSGLSLQKKEKVISVLKPLQSQSVFFSEMLYGSPYHIFLGDKISLTANTTALLVTGIANPAPLKTYLEENIHGFDMLKYPDHHIFSSTDLNDIKQHFAKISSLSKIIITTEKDAVRLAKFEKELIDFPIYALPIKHHILFDEQAAFHLLVTSFVNKFTANI